MKTAPPKRAARKAGGPATFTISGTVTDVDTGAKLPNITVKIIGGSANFGKTAITNNSGKYSMSGIVPERIIIEASGAGYQPLSKSPTITGSTVIDFALKPSTFTITGTVTDAATGVGLANAMVKIIGGSANFGKTAITNSSGKYSMPGIVPERIIIEASAAGYQPLSKSPTITGNTVINFSLKKSTFTIKGRVTDAGTGGGVPNAMVKIIGGSANFGRTAMTDNNGKYSMLGIVPERIIIEASASGHTPASKSPTITGDTVINFAL